MESNRICFIKVIECLQYLARPGQAMQGDTDKESHFIQLLKLRGKDRPLLLKWLSPGQTDQQVVASGCKFNLRRDLRLVAKRTSKFPHKYTRVAKTHFKADISRTSLANNRLMDVTQLALTWVGWPNGEKLALPCVQI